MSVVFATHNRADRLERLLAALRAQTFDGTVEVIAVDDGSSDRTPDVLAQAPVNVLSNPVPRGPAMARNLGWRAATAPFVVFTDDDCAPTPGWLAAMYAAWEGDPERVVQGRVVPDPAERDREGPFTRSLVVDHLGPFFQTANVAYPRALLERVGGFDEETFSVPGGEDADLAHRCFAAGATPVFAPDALTHHAVHELGPVGKLRVAWRWHETVRIYARHPEMRRTLTYRVFWKKSHYLLVRALLGVLVPRALRFWFVGPLAPAYLERARVEGHGALWSAPYFLVHDVVETAGIVRGAVRYRTPVI